MENEKKKINENIEKDFFFKSQDIISQGQSCTIEF